MLPNQAVMPSERTLPRMHLWMNVYPLFKEGANPMRGNGGPVVLTPVVGNIVSPLIARSFRMHRIAS